jgi:hypothetical protein
MLELAIGISLAEVGIACCKQTTFCITISHLFSTGKLLCESVQVGLQEVQERRVFWMNIGGFTPFSIAFRENSWSRAM